MDYSNYTLLSLGCSFTFGQGTIADYTGGPEEREVWRNACNELSYTSHVGKRLKFRKVVNLGTPAGSNELALLNMNTWLDKNKGENVFILFSLADPQREIFFKKVKDYGDKRLKVDSLEVFNASHPHNISPKAIESFYTEINTEINMTFKNWLFRKHLSSVLKYRNLPHLVFHSFDPMDIRVNKLKNKFRIAQGSTHWHNLDIIPDFREWMENIEDEPTFANYLSINHINALSKDVFGKAIHNRSIYSISDYLHSVCKTHKDAFFTGVGDNKDKYAVREHMSWHDGTHYNATAQRILGQLLVSEMHKTN